jgi:hypothetical protein
MACRRSRSPNDGLKAITIAGVLGVRCSFDAQSGFRFSVASFMIDFQVALWQSSGGLDASSGYSHLSRLNF